MSDTEVYRDFNIVFVCPPIPIRTMDWQFSHVDFDVDDRRIGHAASKDECKALIDEYWDEMSAATKGGESE